MVPIWQVTRNRYTRWLYDRLQATGITAARMIEYTLGLTGRTPDPGPEHPAVSFVAGPIDDEGFADLKLAFPIPASPLPGEWVVVAKFDGGAVGRALVSEGTRPYLEPLGRRLSFDGAYVRRVYVRPEWRNRGIAKGLLGRTLRVAVDELDTTTASALIAADNRPSQWVFEAHGFRPVRRHDYVRLFGREFRRERALDTDVGT